MGGVCYVPAGQEPYGHWVLVVHNVEHENNATPLFTAVQIKKPPINGGYYSFLCEKQLLSRGGVDPGAFALQKPG